MPRDDSYSNYGSSRRSGGRRDDRGYRRDNRGYQERSNGESRGYRDNRGSYSSRDYRDDRGYQDRSDDRRYRDDRDRWDNRSYGERSGYRGYRGRSDDRGYEDRSRGYSRQDSCGRRDGRSYRDDRGYQDRSRDDRGYRDDRRRDSRDRGYRAYDADDRPLWSDNPFDRRVEVHCPVASRCGACEWLAMPYEEQLDRKQEYIEEMFADYKCEVDPILGMNVPWGYRNKVQLPFAPGHVDRNGRFTARWGIFERGTHRIVPCRECLVEDERARPIIATVADLLPRFNILPYDEKSGTGLLRYALVRTAHTTGQVMLTLVCNGPRIPSAKAFLDKLVEIHPEITTIVLNVNRERTSVILGDEEKVLMGPGYIEDELCGCRFRISSSSFYQTNPIAAEALYDLAVELACLRPGDRIGDAYCGTGTIGIVAAKQSGAHLMGVERNADAVKDAEENARINGIEDAEFVTGDAGSVFARMARAGRSLDVVFMDPPRAGSSQAFLANLSRLGPRRVVYISCEPRTQRHDISALVKNGYRVTRICPVDMFPHTDHVENVILLERPKHRRGGVNRRKKGDRRDFAATGGRRDTGDANAEDNATASRPFEDEADFDEDGFEGFEGFESFEETEDVEGAWDDEGLDDAGSFGVGADEADTARTVPDRPAAPVAAAVPAPAAKPSSDDGAAWDDDLAYSPSDEVMALMAGIDAEPDARPEDGCGPENG